ncbi:MotA/TolQ/ExbB proton channel family protein [Pendulispora albinea]|uniref:MotA/TolQ/ExbB proton channel family protein n=1 Tax=Pendulispora albinea TaxID=2741071 RepID=A0ABZ2M3Y1_9BACT
MGNNEIIERVKNAMVGAGAAWVLWLMLILSVVSLAIMLERAWLYFSLRDDVGTLMRELGKLLRAGDLEGARKRLEASPSAEAAVVLAGVVEASYGADAAAEAMAGASALQKTKLEKRLAYLGTLGNNAPFIGLLGTVIGIVGAFEELGKANAKPVAQAGAAAAANAAAAAASAANAGAQIASAAVMSNIAEALVATAVGLVVAIPAVAAFNMFQRIVKTTLSNTDALGHVLLAYLKSTEKGLLRPAAAGAGSSSPAPTRRVSQNPQNPREDDEGAN